MFKNVKICGLVLIQAFFLPIAVYSADFGYCPQCMSMWDSWFIASDGKVHMFHLQQLAGGSPRTPLEAETIGHAVSEDMVHWTELPLALAPLADGGIDDLRLYTGCTVEHNGQFYMFYTMRGSKDDGYGQKTGLAFSKDLVNWQRYEKNPVIVPDPKYYISYDRPMANKTVDCRDLTIVRDEKNNRWVGFYAARMRDAANAQCAAIAAVESNDLLNWKHLSPAFAPGKYTNIEVPEIYHIKGKWYLSSLTCIGFGPRGIFSEEYMDHGTIYAWSDNLEGPYQEFVDDNVLIADTNGNAAGIACRAVNFKGETYGFYTERFPDAPHRLSPPMKVTTDEQGHLRYAFSGYTELFRAKQLISPDNIPSIAGMPVPVHQWPLHSGAWELNGNVLTGEAKNGWQIAYLGGCSDNVEIIADIELNAVAAGIVYSTATHGNLVFMLDSTEKAVISTYTPVFPLLHIRHFDINKGGKYNLRVVKRARRFEVYVDDLLALGFFENYPDMQKPQIGVIVDRGSAKIDNFCVYELENK